ncbi:hypothetical protein TSOC_009038 [Tetrabaena socialis]|uniref:Uncharacterized protein n=1 Tax=Tetrabaena socialis TaxID=47790 RepID=A0A2J7ZWT5_9CHLO|nr:hypothetical protein TSOC_009038 [Tetrabaena socialis]|eukprot:PNH04729.1 hypothetical protein TSOC_009038 [Tetrabaena socialis]
MLHSLPEGLCALSRLADLDLSANQLQRLPPDFTALTGLTHLHLGGLHGLDIAAVCPLLTGLTNLHALGLCDVDLSDFGHYPYGNAPGGEGDAAVQHEGPLAMLAAALGPAGRLRELLLDGCGLEGLPPGFSQLTALTHLSVMENFDATVGKGGREEQGKEGDEAKGPKRWDASERYTREKDIEWHTCPFIVLASSETERRM